MDNDSKSQLVEKFAPFNVFQGMIPFELTRAKYQEVTSQNLHSLSHISLNYFFFIIHKNTIYTKKFVVQHRLCVTYLYVYVNDNISKENSSNFPKSPNAHS